MPPRVTIVTNMPTGHQSELFTALARRPEIAVHVLFLRRLTPGRQWTRLLENPYPHTFVRELRVHSSFYLNAGLFRALRATRPDLIVVGQYAGVGMQAVMYWATLARIPWVFWSERPGVEWAELPPVRWEPLRVALRQVALAPLRAFPRAVWGIGRRAEAHYAGLTRAPTANVPYTSDLDRFFALPRGPVPDPPRVLFSGKLNERKAADLVIRAVERLWRDGHTFSLDVMGGGPLQPEVEALCARWPDRARLLGFKELDEVPGVLGAHDVLLCPSRYDGWGMVVPEGMAAGMTVLTTTGVGAAIDMVRDGVNGYAVAPDSEEALTRGLARVLAERDRLADVAARAREDARAYHCDAGAALFAGQCLEALEPRRSPRP